MPPLDERGRRKDNLAMSNDKLPIKERYFEGDESFTKDYVKSLDTNDVRFWDAYAKAIDQYVSAKKEK